MTVAELIEKLAQLPQEAVVVVWHDGYGYKETDEPIVLEGGHMVRTNASGYKMLKDPVEVDP